MITEVNTLAPEIKQFFNPLLLMSYIQRIEYNVDKKIVPLSKKKIRSQDTGKRKKFDKLLNDFLEMHERKENDQADYYAEIKKKIKERSCIPTTGETMRFKRMDTSK